MRYKGLYHWVFTAACLLVCLLRQPLSAQAEDPMGQNNFFHNAPVLMPDSSSLDSMAFTDIDIYAINLDTCTAYRFFWGFRDTSSSQFAIQFSLYHQNDTLQPFYTGKVKRDNRHTFQLNGAGAFYLKMHFLIPGINGPYGVLLRADTTEHFECNNIPDQAISLGLSGELESVLRGFATSGNPDEDWYSVTVPQCGVLRLDLMNAASQQRLVLSVLSEQQELVNKITASGEGESVNLTALLSTGKYFIKIADFDTCCGTGNDTVYNFSQDKYMLVWSFDTSDESECNNRFEDAYLLPIGTAVRAKLNGVDYRMSEQAWDLDYFKLTPNKCGVLSLSATQVPADQALELTVYNSRRQQIDFAVAACHGCNVSLSTLTDGEPVYVKITEFNGCCSGNNAIYNLSNQSYTLNSSFDDSDIYECNNQFSDAHSIANDGAFNFKINGRNTNNRLGAADRDIFKMTSNTCREALLKIDQIPVGFDLKVKVISDSLNPSSALEEEVVKGPDSLSLSVQVPPNKTYYLIITEDGENAFSNQMMRLRVSWSNKGPEPPVITVIGDTNMCEGDSVILVSSIAEGNSWSNGDSTQTIVVKNPGEYTDTIGNSGEACYSMSAPVRVHSVNAPTASFTIIDVEGSTAFVNTSVASSNYFWDFGDGSTSSERDPSHSYATPGNYQVKLVVSNNCGRDSMVKSVNVTVGIFDFANQSLLIYPQPSNGSFQVKNLSSSPASSWFYQVFDNSGRSILSGKQPNEQGLFNLNLPDGFYFLLLTNGPAEKKLPLMIRNH
ncbi:MAG: PKD domain-containing protein [Bacteroidia bacterium]|nr:PKD domain-containing protein [Bacteroidia bacterium]